MSNQQADMRQHEQEMRANYQEFAKENVYLIDDLNNGYEIWKAATLAAEETFNQRLVELTSRIRELEDTRKYAEYWLALVDAHKFNNKPSVGYAINRAKEKVDRAIGAALTEHKENQG